MLKQGVEGGSQDIGRLEVVTSDNRKKAPALADLQIQNKYNTLCTGEDEQDLSEDSTEPSQP